MSISDEIGRILTNSIETQPLLSGLTNTTTKRPKAIAGGVLAFGSRKIVTVLRFLQSEENKQ